MPSHNNISIARMVPQLVRKRVVVTPQTIQIAIQPSRKKVVELKQTPNQQLRKQTKQIIPPQAPLKPPRIPPQAPNSQAAVSRKDHLQRKKSSGQVKIVTRDATPESLPKIKALRDCGVGKVLVIIGNGPSINEAALEKLRDQAHIDIMSVNKPDSRVWPTKYWTFFDLSQMRRNEDLWNEYNGIIFNSTAIKRQKQTSMQLKNVAGLGFSTDLSKGIHIGRSSVYAAMQIGYWMGYDHIYIMGCDMDPSGLNGKLHFYGNNPDVDPEVRKTKFQKEAEYYDNASNVLTEGDRRRFTFCSSYNPWGFVEKFGRLDHKIAIQTILDHYKKTK